MTEDTALLVRSQEFHLVFSELVSAARHLGLVTYQEVAKILGLPMAGNYMGSKIGAIAGEISSDEHAAGRPLLSAILVNTTGRPGPGFFELARILGRLESTDSAAERRFWEKEVKSVHETWKVILPS